MRRIADGAAPLGKWYATVPASAAVATALVVAERRGRPMRAPRSGALAIVASASLAAALSKVFDYTLPQPPAPPGHRARTKPVFPSGHAFATSALSLSTAWVLSREGTTAPLPAAALALALPLLSTGGKIVEEKHWVSDALGGLLAGTAVSAWCLTAYELDVLRER